MPGVYLIATSSETCSGEIPTSRASRRSSRPTRSRTGLSRSAIARVSIAVFGISLTQLTIAEGWRSLRNGVDGSVTGDAVADEQRVRVEAATGELDLEAVDAAAELLRSELLGSARPGDRHDGVVAVDPAPPPRHFHDRIPRLGRGDDRRRGGHDV